jgi:hypothetical protein
MLRHMIVTNFCPDGQLRPRRGADVTNLGESLYDEV